MMESCGEISWSGEFPVTLDEKGRIVFPSKLRKGYSGATLFITQGPDNCLWVFTEQKWMALKGEILATVSPFTDKGLEILRKFIGPAKPVVFDKSDRLSIPQDLRDHAHLSKECVIVGFPNYLELWDAAAHKQYKVSNEPSFKEAMEGLSGIHF
jgi:MraZ protein